MAHWHLAFVVKRVRLAVDCRKASTSQWFQQRSAQYCCFATRRHWQQHSDAECQLSYFGFSSPFQKNMLSFLETLNVGKSNRHSQLHEGRLLVSVSSSKPQKPKEEVVGGGGTDQIWEKPCKELEVCVLARGGRKRVVQSLMRSPGCALYTEGVVLVDRSNDLEAKTLSKVALPSSWVCLNFNQLFQESSHLNSKRCQGVFTVKF